MRIGINAIEHKYRYDVEHIIKLFYEDPELIYENEGSVDSGDKHELFLELSLKEVNDEVHAQVHVADLRGTNSKSFESRPVAEAKKALNIALLKALMQYTGIEQPWGILTGVRPVKLYHQHYQKGMSPTEIAKELESQYYITKPKIQVMERIVEKQLEVVPDLYHLDHELSIYIGIPFCPTKCAYCTFPAYSIQGKQGSVDAFLLGLHSEIEQMGEWLRRNKIGITSIYFGGGTPTSITAEEMDALFETLSRSFPDGGKSRELTVEAGRPDTITPEKIEVMKKWKVDRISINPQSFTQSTLKAIGRHHTVRETIEKYQLAREMGMDNINMDLIIGLPGEGMKEYKHSLEMVEELLPESLTVHTLSFKSASAMTQNKEKYVVASSEEVRKMIALTEEWTNAHGYNPYYLYRQKNILGNQENVGYALPGKESIYNIMIMEEKQTILGLGCGAASKIISPITKKITRIANPKEPKVYNEHYQKYIDDKIRLLDEQYGFVSTG